MKIILFISILYTLSLAADRLINEGDVNRIYDTYIKCNQNDEYIQRYIQLPIEKNLNFWRWEGKDFPRVIALLEFERFVKNNKISSHKTLAINGANDPELYYLSSNSVFYTSYDANPIEHNLYCLNLPEKDFDFVMVNQTFEHIYDPILCLKNIYNHMQQGGMLYFNVPANGISHCAPFHFYTGFTPAGIGAIVEAAGFKILHIGHWGNVEYICKMFSTNSWPDYRNLTNPGINDFDNPVIVWIFAIKE